MALIQRFQLHLTKQCYCSSNNSSQEGKLTTTISDSRSHLWEIVKLARHLSWMLFPRHQAQSLKMKNPLSCTLKQPTTQMMPTSTKSFTSTCQARNDITSTSTSTRLARQQSCSCSILPSGLASKKLNNGSTSVRDATCQSKSQLETWLTLLRLNNRLLSKKASPVWAAAW